MTADTRAWRGASGWRDHLDRPTERPDPPRPDAPAAYEPIGDFQGPLYRRNAFAAATEAEVDALVAQLRLGPGDRVLDVGCGDGRHLRAGAGRGLRGVGVDVSRGLVDAARAAAADADLGDVTFVRHDARRLGEAVDPASFDAAWSLSQGAVGVDPDGDRTIVAALAAALRPGGRLAVTVFHALFAARHLAPGDAFDPVRLLHHQQADVRGPDDRRRRFDLWTTSYTVPDAVRLIEDAGLVVEGVRGAEPGRYDGAGVRLDDPELLLVGRRPAP